MIISLIFLGCLVLTVSGQTQKFRLRVVTEQANIRLKPDIGSEMIWQVRQGIEMEAEKKEGEWYLVVLEKPDGSLIRGYVHESLVEIVTSGLKPTVSTGIRQPESRPPKSVPVSPVQAETKGANFLMTFFGGGAYLSPGDLNRAAQGVTDYYLADLNAGRKASLRGLHLVFCYGLDIFYHFSRQLALGLGFDYQQGADESAVNFSISNLNYGLVTRPGIKNLSFRVSMLFQPANIFYIRVGLETNLARLSYLYRIEQDDSWMEWRGRANGLNVGWTEAAGVQLPVASWLQLYAEGAYRYARIRNFEGTNYYLDSDGLERTEKGKLYYWTVNSDGKYYPALFIRDRLPTDPGVTAPRTADIDLSGLSLRAGLRLSF